MEQAIEDGQQDGAEEDNRLGGQDDAVILAA